MSRVGRTLAVALTGLEAHIVDVEVMSQPSGLPAFALVGLPDAALGESRDRVRAALASAGLRFPPGRVTANLSPAYLPKAGSGFDLGIAVAALASTGQVRPEAAEGAVYLGELSLDGRVRPVRGVLPAVAGAVAQGRPRVVVPAACLAEAQLVKGAEAVGVETLEELAWLMGGDVPQPPPSRRAAPAPTSAAPPAPSTGDLAEVLGQATARYALEVAAAGGHHLMLQGPPGNGKTMLASRLPGILPPLSEAEAIEVTALHSVAGTLDPRGGLIRRPPFQDPHHTATPAAMVGGGSGIPRPGAISLAHRGVLFLDECPEFSPRVLQSLRQPLERGEVVIHRAHASARFPARFHLVMAANPCPCGQGYGRGEKCACTAAARRHYQGKVSGPLLDRIDMWVDVDPVAALPAGPHCEGESSARVAARVAAARAAQAGRFAGLGWAVNAEAPGAWLRRSVGQAKLSKSRLEAALGAGALSLRGVDRVLRVAWTMADLDGREAPTVGDIDAAMTLRQRGL
ncbi:MAG: YifB family Mg chelatase-like AAA ATPase [Bifidobacteriaceae bacterium]|nr:YifB family Mg chelatase-like AAA ATPase [Bifidobacteriaceae bacterium]